MINFVPRVSLKKNMECFFYKNEKKVISEAPFQKEKFIE